MKHTLRLPLGLALVIELMIPLLPAAEPRPNILHIHADDHRAEHPEVVARLTKLLEQIIADGRSTHVPKQANEAQIVIRKRNTTIPNQ